MKEHKIGIDNLSVCIGMPSSRNIDPLVVKSMFLTQALCMSHGIPCQLAMIAGNAVVQWARDEVIDLYLQSDANRLFCIDSDIVWEPEDFMRLLALSQKRDIVCAAYPAKKEPATFYIRYDKSGTIEADEYGLLEILGIGLGFTVFQREVIEKISESSPKLYDEISQRELASIFHIGNHKGKRRGEDMSFFESLTDLGYKVHLDPSVELGHIGHKVYRGKIMDVLERE